MITWCFLAHAQSPWDLNEDEKENARRYTDQKSRKIFSPVFFERLERDVIYFSSSLYINT